jgi:hypothetical protein
MLVLLLLLLLLLLLVFRPWAGLAGTRAQSDDRYGSGTLRSRQGLRGSLPLLSPAFGRSHFRRQMPPRPHQRERSQQRKVELSDEKWPANFACDPTSM